MKIITNKKIVILFISTVFLLIFSKTAFAVGPFPPGTEDNPQCLPSEIDCDVIPAIITEIDPVFSTWLTITPPLYSYTETDPIYSAWNKSTGISITESQISDLRNYLTSYTETDPIYVASQAHNISSGDITNLSHLLGTNSGDDAINSLYSGLVTNATHTGDATGATALTVVGFNNTLLSGLGTGLLKNTTGTGVPSIAVNTDLPAMTATVGGAVPTPPNNTTTFLRGDGTFATPTGGGDMVLASIQSVTGLKTFDKDKLAMKGTSTGITTFSTANTGATDYTVTFPSASGTLALTSDLTSGYIPYTGGTSNIDLGIHNLTVDTNTLFVDSVNHRVGIGTTEPSEALEIGTNTTGLNQKINATLGSEMAPALTGNSGDVGGWTLSNVTGYTQPFADSIAKTGDGTGTITPTDATTIVTGTTYKVVITVASISGSTAYFSLGNVFRSLTAAQTYTEYVTAEATAKLVITPLGTGLRINISSISIKALTSNTGDLTVEGDLMFNGSIITADGIRAIKILPNGGTIFTSTNLSGAALLTEINTASGGTYGLRTNSVIKGGAFYLYNTTGGFYTSGGVPMFYQAVGNLFGMGATNTVSKFDVIQPPAGVGTVSNSASGTTVTGVGTVFTDTFKIGNTITATGGTSETRTISAIASNTSMTTDAWTNAHTTSAYTLIGGTRFSVKGNGNVGIGTTTPAHLLTMGTGGGFYDESTGAWIDGSDRNYKDNILDLTKYGLETINKLHPVSYIVKSSGVSQIGFIAQEVKEVIPELVSGQDGSMGLNYGGFAPVIVKSVQELDLKLEDLAIPVDETTNKPFIERFFDKMISWLGSDTNGLDKICIKKSDGTEFCANGDDLEKAVNGLSSTSTISTSSTPTTPTDFCPNVTGIQTEANGPCGDTLCSSTSTWNNETQTCDELTPTQKTVTTKSETTESNTNTSIENTKKNETNTITEGEVINQKGTPL